MSVAEIFSIIKDILFSIAAITTAAVAVIGLKNWSRELRGKTEFEAARHLMKVTYRVRDELQYSRSPLIRAGEFPSDYPGTQSATTEEEAQAWNYIYSNRWTPVREALQEFDTHALEAEALWGHKIREKTDELKHCARKIQVAMEAIIQDKANQGEDFRMDREFGKKMRSVVHASSGDENNALNIKIKATIDGIEDLVRPHLQRR